MSPHHSNDDKSPLIDLLVCIVCRETMKIEKSTLPTLAVRTSFNIVVGGVIELSGVRLFRRSRDVAGLKAKGK